MRLREHYDWIVIGRHPAGLLSAGLAAKLGLSVLVVSAGEDAGAGSSLRVGASGSDELLDLEPNILLGCWPGGPQAVVLDRLALASAEARLIHPASHPTTSPIVGPAREGAGSSDGSGFEIATPGARWRPGGESEELESELGREFGVAAARESGIVPAMQAVGDAFGDEWGSLPERLTLAQGRDAGRRAPRGEVRRIRRLSGRAHRVRGNSATARCASGGDWAPWLRAGVPLSLLRARMERGAAGPEAARELSSALLGAWYGLAASDAGDPSLQALLRLLWAGRNGAWVEGGLSAYRNLLLRVGRRLGAHVPDDVSCRAMFVSGRRLAGIQLAGHGTVVTATGAALSCGLASGGALVSGGKDASRALRRALSPSGWRFTMAVRVRSEGLPPGFPRRVVWQEQGAPPLEIDVAEPGDYGASMAGAGQRVLFVRTVLPFVRKAIDSGELCLVAARMFRQLGRLLPFVEYHVTGIFPDFRDGSEGISRTYGFDAPQRVPEALRVYGPAGTGLSSGVEGLFVLSGETSPELGSMGWAVSALEAVAWLAHRSGLPGPLG